MGATGGTPASASALVNVLRTIELETKVSDRPEAEDFGESYVNARNSCTGRGRGGGPILSVQRQKIWATRVTVSLDVQPKVEPNLTSSEEFREAAVF